jgi:hypothetical protein
MGFLKQGMQRFNSQFANPADRIGSGLDMIARGGGADAGYSGMQQQQRSMQEQLLPMQPMQPMQQFQQPMMQQPMQGNNFLQTLFSRLLGRGQM